MIYSAGVLDVPSTIVTGLWRQQLLWFALAMLATPLILRIPVIWLEWAAQPVYALALVLLVLTLFIGTGAGTAASVSGWIGVGPGADPALGVRQDRGDPHARAGARLLARAAARRSGRSGSRSPW